MQLPFTTDQFLNVFAVYNKDVWPFQVILNAAALIGLIFALRKTNSSSVVISSILAFFWVWMGAVYHLIYFRAINPAALLFGILFICQGFLIAYTGAIKRKLSYAWPGTPQGLLGALILLYALVLYPLLGMMLGHQYPHSPTFGLPCPTTIFTFGMFLWTDSKFPRVVLIIPSLWAVIGFTAALSLGIREDISLLIAALISVPVLLIGRAKLPRESVAG